MEKVLTPGLDYGFYVVLVRVVDGISIPDYPVSGWAMNLCSIAGLKTGADNSWRERRQSVLEQLREAQKAAFQTQ